MVFEVPPLSEETLMTVSVSFGCFLLNLMKFFFTFSFLSIGHLCSLVFQSEHKEILAKLEFVDELVQCILEIAHSYGSRFESGTMASLGRSPGSARNAGFGAMENLLVRVVLEMKILELLSTSIEMAQAEMKAGRLLPSTAVKSGKFL